MKIFTSNFYRAKGKEHYSISVSRPKWDNSITVIRMFVPKWEWVSRWNEVKHLPDNNQEKQSVRIWYTENYIRYLKSLSIEEINSVLEDGMILCCWCKKDEFCHRNILAEYLRTLGYEVEEL